MKATRVDRDEEDLEDMHEHQPEDTHGDQLEVPHDDRDGASEDGGRERPVLKATLSGPPTDMPDVLPE